jgi:hypothetical protein
MESERYSANSETDYERLERIMRLKYFGHLKGGYTDFLRDVVLPVVDRAPEHPKLMLRCYGELSGYWNHKLDKDHPLPAYRVLRGSGIMISDQPASRARWALH